MATEYGISSRQEGEAYLEHAILGPRIRECTGLVNLVEGALKQRDFRPACRPEISIFDDLVRGVAPHDQIFKNALQKYFGGEPDRSTIEML